MSAAEQMQEKPEPDFFANQAWMIGEIVLAHQILNRKIAALRAANHGKSSVSQKLAAEEVSKLAEQLKLCSDIVARKSAEYLNRKPHA